MELMIRIERGLEVSPGTWEYHCDAYPSVCGRSRQPLLDACRQFKSLHGSTREQQMAIYREGRVEPDMVCPIEVGAAYTVSEPAKGGAPKFAKYQAFDFSGLRSEREAV